MFDELHLYDFDGTLFRSPDSPDWWNQDVMGWFIGHPWSLCPPCVPKEPGYEWWIQPSINQALDSIANPRVLAVLCTGRDESVFGERVRELLAQQGLAFAEIHCNPGTDTSSWKSEMLEEWLSLYPEILSVRIWDDRLEYLKEYQRAAQPFEVDVEAILVDSPCEEQEQIQRIAGKYARNSRL
jgi:hypothetical protein